eukprot:s2529_g10.t1
MDQLRVMICLRAMTVSTDANATSSAASVEEIDYEALLDSLEEDLKVIHTVPLTQVKRALDRWTEAIKREVDMLFKTGTLRKVDLQEIRKLESEGTF